MRKRIEQESAIPKFANEQAEADWYTNGLSGVTPDASPARNSAV